MKRLIVVGLMFAALLRSARADEEKFTASVSPEDLAAIGLSGLTPAQLARLDALVEAYKSGALATARRAAADALAAKQAAEAQAARAEAKVEAARAETAKAEAANAEAARTAATKTDPGAKPGQVAGLLAKAKVLLTPGTKVEVVPVESTIAGKFRGWEPRQVFTLANGQRWQVAGDDRYYRPAVENPKVQILPAAMAGYWLRFPDFQVQVRVNFLGDN